MKFSVLSVFFVSSVFTYAANGATISYTPTLGTQSSYDLKFTDTGSVPGDLVYSFLNADNTITEYNISYDWNIVNRTLGDGTTANIYLQWGVDSKGNKVLNTVAPTTPQFGVNYDVAAYVDPTLNKRFVNTSTAGVDINHSFIGLTATNDTLGTAIYNAKGFKIGEINGDFIGNQKTITDGSSIAGAALYNLGTIDSINGSFIGNYSSSPIAVSTNALVGAVISNRGGGDIGSITGDFVGNGSYSVNPVGALVIENRMGTAGDFSTIGTISGDFIGNYINSTKDSRAIVYNMEYARIENITGNFIDNVVQTNLIEAEGSAIYNANWNSNGVGGEIGTISASFINNRSVSDAATYGSSIYNGTKSTIDSIKNSSFVGNYLSGGTSAFGGVIYNDNATIKSMSNVNFNTNYASAGTSSARGGVIYNYNNGVITDTENLNFIGNYAISAGSGAYGGAIYNSSTINDLNANFYANYTDSSGYSYGGALYNAGTITNATGIYDGNYSKSGGAIYNSVAGDLNLTNSTFSNNYVISGASRYGGAIVNFGDLSISDTTFNGNYIVTSSGYADGGAIANWNAGLIDVLNADFIGNYTSSSGSYAGGGAVFNYNNSVIDSIDGDFKNNYVTSSASYAAGGAIYNAATSTIGDISGSFGNNSALSTANAAYGGAIYTASGSKFDLIEADFIGNFTSSKTTFSYGGAIYLSSGTEITNISGNFFDNYTTTSGSSTSLFGGAIFLNGTSTVGLLANTDDMYFSGNYNGVKSNDSAIYLGNGAIINITANNGYDVIFNDGIAAYSLAGNNINFDSTSGTAGRFVVNNFFDKTNINIKAGTLVLGEENTYTASGYTGVGARDITIGDFLSSSNVSFDADTALDAMNGVIQNTNITTLTLNGDMNYHLDVDFQNATQSADFLDATVLVNPDDYKIIISDVNIMSDADSIGTSVQIADDTLRESIVLSNSVNVTNPAGSSVLYENLIGYDSALGHLTFTYGDLNSAVANNIAQKVYSMTQLENVSRDLGAMFGNSLIVNGNGYNIDGNNFGGASYASGKVATYNNLGNVFNFTGGFITNNLGTINLTANTYDKAGVDTNTASIIYSDIVNNNILNITANTNNSIEFDGNLSGAGTLNINNELDGVSYADDNDGLGAITFDGTVASNNINIVNGSVVFNDSVTSDLNITGGMVYINSDFAGDIALSQNTSIKSALSFGAGAGTTYDSLTLDGNATLSFVNGATNSYTFDTIKFLNNSETKLELDVNLENPGVAGDMLDVTTIDGSGSLLISKINITKDPNFIPVSVTVAGANLKNHVSLAADVDVTKMNIPVTDDGLLIFYNNGTGNLDFNFNTLQAAISSVVPAKSFAMIRDAKLDSLTGNLSGVSLAIDGGGFDIIANTPMAGIIVGGGKSLHLREVANITGFTTALQNTGALGITADNGVDVLFSGNTIDIQNAGMAYVQATADRKVTFNGAINNTGIFNINDESNETGEVIFNGALSGSIVNTYYGTTTFNNSLFSNLSINDGIVNLNDEYSNGNITLNGGTLNFGAATTIDDAKLIVNAESSLNTLDGSVKSYTFDEIELNDDVEWGLDINLSNNSSDKLITSNISGSGEFILTDIQILADALSLLPSVTVNIASDDVKNYISLAGELDLNIINGGTSSEDYDNYLIGYEKTDGNLSFALATLNTAVSSSVNDKLYEMNSDEGITMDLGALNGTELEINGNGHNIMGNNSVNGIVVGNNKTLVLNNVAVSTGFDNGFLTIDGDNASVEINASTHDSVIDATIVNDGNLDLITTNDKKMELSDISGSGDLNLTGDILFSGNLTGNYITTMSGEFTFDGLNNSGVIINSNDTLNFNGNFKNSTFIITAGGELNFGKDVVFEGIAANVTDSTINLKNDEIQNVDFDVLTLKGTTSLILDIDLDAGTSDKITASDITGSGNLKLTELNILTDASEIETTVNIADEEVRGHILTDLSGLTVSEITGVSEDYSGYFIGYSQSTGDLTFAYHGLNSAILSDVETKAYTLLSDEMITSDLLSLSGNSLVINGNGYDIVGDNIATGVSVDPSKTLTFKDVANVSGFDGDVIYTEGTVNIIANNYNSIFEQAIEVADAGILNIEANGYDVTLESGVYGDAIVKKTGTGDLTLNVGSNSFTGTFNQTAGDVYLNTVAGGGFAGVYSKSAGDLYIDATVSDGVSTNFTQTNGTTYLTSSAANGFSGNFASTGGNLVINANAADSLSGNFTTSGGTTITLAGNKFLFDNANFRVNGATNLELADSDIHGVNLGDLTLNSNLNVGLDVDLSGTPSADTLSANSVSGSGKIVIDSLNILGDASIIETSVLIADNIVKGSVVLDSNIASNITRPSGSTVDYGALVGYENTTGMLEFKYADLKTAINQNFAQKVYNMFGNETINSDIGAMGGDNLIIDADGFNITGNNIGGMTVGANQELTLTDVGTVSGFNGAFISANSNAIINLNATNTDTVLNNSIVNNAVFNAETSAGHTITFAEVSGNGTLNTDGDIIFNGNIANNNINVNSGSIDINKNITGGSITLKSGTDMDIDSTSVVSGVDLNATNADINIANGTTQNVNFGTVTLTGTSNIDLDVDLANLDSDYLTATSVGGTGNLKIDNLNITSDLASMAGTGENINVTNSILASKISILGMNIVDVSGGLTEDYNLGYLITFNNSTGVMNFKHANLITAMASNVADKVYALSSSDLNITSDLGTFNGINFTVDGNGQTMNGANNNGFVVNAGQSFALRETNMVGFDTAIENNGTTDIISGPADVLFKNNAVAIENTGVLNLNANGADILFDGNTVALNNSGDLNILSDMGSSVQFNDDVTGAGDININNDANATGKLVISNDVFAGYTGDITLYNGTIELLRPDDVFTPNPDPLLPDLVDPTPTEYTDFLGGNFIVENTFGMAPTLDLTNNARDTLNAANWTLNGDLNVSLDIDLANRWSDSIINTDNAWAGSININDIVLLTDFDYPVTISVTDNTGGGNFTIDSGLTQAQAPIYIYDIDSSLLASEGKLSFSGPNKFNPAILMGEVMGQINNVSQNHIINNVMTNFADNGEDGVWGNHFYEYGYDKDKPNVWVKSYGYNEQLNLNDGISPNGQYYGTLVGVDTPNIYCYECTNAVLSFYTGYYGSTQEYVGGDLQEDGFVVGSRLGYFNNNFFGSFAGQYAKSEFNGTTAFGDEEATSNTLTLAGQTGYNFWLSANEWALQPIVNLTYMKINRPEYENASGIDISEENLKSFQYGTELKLTRYFSGNWSSYGSVSYNKNDMDSNDVMAETTQLTNLGYGTYMSYTLGANKNFGNSWRGYGQIEALTGDREGFGIEIGANITF